jgi:hypothetical protein
MTAADIANAGEPESEPSRSEAAEIRQRGILTTVCPISHETIADHGTVLLLERDAVQAPREPLPA